MVFSRAGDKAEREPGNVGVGTYPPPYYIWKQEPPSATW